MVMHALGACVPIFPTSHRALLMHVACVARGRFAHQPMYAQLSLVSWVQEAQISLRRVRAGAGSLRRQCSKNRG